MTNIHKCTHLSFLPESCNLKNGFFMFWYNFEGQKTTLMKNTGLKNLPTSSEGFPCISVGKESACSARDLGLIPGSGKIPWRKKWQPPPVYLLVKSHGQRSLVGCSPGDPKESGTTERLTLTYLLTRSSTRFLE